MATTSLPQTETAKEETAIPPTPSPLQDDAATVPAPQKKKDQHQQQQTTPKNNKKKKDEASSSSFLRSPPAILALGAMLDHILTCDCSFRNVPKMLQDETNDTLQMAYRHHTTHHAHHAPTHTQHHATTTVLHAK
jgi:hypothetical protein